MTGIDFSRLKVETNLQQLLRILSGANLQELSARRPAVQQQNNDMLCACAVANNAASQASNFVNGKSKQKGTSAHL